MSAFFHAIVGRTGLNPVEAKRFVKFTVVGAVGAVVDFGSFNLLVSVFQHTGWVTGRIMPAFAGTLSFILAIISNFIWNRYWTYPDSRSKPLVRQFLQFFFVNALALLIRVPILTYTSQPFAHLTAWLVPSFSEAVTLRLGKNLALALAVGLAMFWNFFVNRYWTYSDVDKGRGEWRGVSGEGRVSE
ncbi:MAG: GtrA family protein [Ardenticatenales bacterium]|nr:GtrA family protein [Ardenticatenales bacterium]